MELESLLETRDGDRRVLYRVTTSLENLEESWN